MGIGIQICGLNGCGKSTLGKALAEKIGFHFIDNENLYFSRTNTDEPYTNAKSRIEVERLLMEEVSRHPDFVFSAVKGDYGKDIVPMYNYVVVIEVPRKIRSQRVRNRSFQKFGSTLYLLLLLYFPYNIKTSQASITSILSVFLNLSPPFDSLKC